jgi:hypothetical protein
VEQNKKEDRIFVRGNSYADTLENMNKLFLDRHWSDGLPLVPPTEEAVRAMLTGTSHSPDEAVGSVDPSGNIATVRTVAVNAVMAGAKPEYMPVILAAVEAMAEPIYNLKGAAATTGASSPLSIISGPIAKELNINSGQNALGIGWRANASIGRAISLIIKNVGEVVTGVVDMTTLGGSWEFTCCLAENEEAMPPEWAPFRVDMGYGKDVSTITVRSIMGQLNVFGSTVTGAKLLLTIASAIANSYQSGILGGMQVVVTLAPQHVALVAGDGFSKEDVKRFIYENARVPFNIWKELGDSKRALNWAPLVPKWVADSPDNYMMYTIPKADDILVIVAGGFGMHSAWSPGGLGIAVTKVIDKWR